MYEVNTEGHSRPKRSDSQTQRRRSGRMRRRSARSSSPCSGTTSCRRSRGTPARSSASSGVRSARTATVRWSGAVPSRQDRGGSARHPLPRADPAGRTLPPGGVREDRAMGRSTAPTGKWSHGRWRLGASSSTDLLPGMADLGVRITYLPSELGQDNYQDFAIPFNGQPRG